MILKFIVGALGAIFISVLAFWKGSLSFSGMLAAIVMGTIYYGAGNSFWFGLLLLFFITSSLFSKFRGERKEELEKSYAKSSQRDSIQVFANGGLGMLACLAYAIYPLDFFILFFVGSMAAVTADTWATEWGGLSRSQPISIVTFRKVPAGTSGGVSGLGTLATFVAAAMIGIAAYLLLLWTNMNLSSLSHLSVLQWLFIVVISGVVGAFVDSWLGGTVQFMQKCTVCHKEVEVEVHCDTATVHLRGWRWLNNDVVNLISAGIAGVVAWGLYYIVS
jgi:uncharacterized protein (TIGR00297 family)